MWTVIEQVLQKDYMINSPDEGKLSGTDIKVGQKVFLERRPEGLREPGDNIHNSEIYNAHDEEFLQEC